MPTAVHKLLLGKFRSKNGLWTFMSDRAVSGDFSFIFPDVNFSFAFLGLRVAGFEEDSDGSFNRHHLRESEEESHAGEFYRDC